MTSGFSRRPDVASFPSQESSPPAKSLFSQSAVLVLEREFPSTDISYLLLDARSGTLLSSRWDDPAKPIPLGSLVKPFTALAYAETHENQFPSHVCRGEASGCWQVRPHGKLNLVSAISVSCNSYFRALAESLTGEQLIPVANRFGLDPPEWLARTSSSITAAISQSFARYSPEWSSQLATVLGKESAKR